MGRRCNSGAHELETLEDSVRTRTGPQMIAYVGIFMMHAYAVTRVPWSTDYDVALIQRRRRFDSARDYHWGCSSTVEQVTFNH